ncbi:MFS transporter [Nocardioides sp. InS609-2]|uniref:MFS transporter n=1 Tax=Nocardioides sp. InS609-2 TaxID=2760705 RepID=UPI0020BECD3A|nr:MFS transporter [Nocardioides sp. InS609-2]
MTLAAPTTDPDDTVISRSYALTTVGMVALVFFAAFEALAVTTVMPQVARELDGVHLYAISFAAPLATGIVGMVVCGIWSDRRGPVPPLYASVVLFAFGLLVCGLAPTMEILVVGRLVQGLGAGALTVGLYVVVGQVYPARLQPSIFAGFAAAWVLPSLFGPSIAAFIAAQWGWEWVFLSVVGLVAVATTFVVPSLLGLRGRPEPTGARVPVGQLGWAAVAAVAVLSLDLLGSRPGLGLLFAAAAGAVVLVSVRHLVPPRTLSAARGLPSVVLTRGALGASFFCAEAYLPFVLQDHWGLSTGRAGLALAAAGICWASASQVQARLGARLTDERAMLVGTALLMAGAALSLLATGALLHPVVLMLGYALAAVGMGTAFPRTSVAMLRHSTERDRGFNSSALSIADSLGAALALALCGVTYAAVSRTDLSGVLGDPFAAVFTISVAWALVAHLASRRTPVS